MSDRPQIIIIRETVWGSLIRDAGSFAVLVALTGIGVVLSSAAMQWLGAILGFCCLLARTSHAANSNRMTIPEARRRLDELEARP